VWIGCALLAVTSATAPVTAQIVNRATTDRFGIAGKDAEMLVDASQRLNQSDAAAVGSSDGWANPDTGNSGSVTVTSIFTWQSLPCHGMRYEIQFKGKTKKRIYNEAWCRVASGDWKLKS
jgi:surface antigen